MGVEYLLAIKADRNTCKPYTGPGWIGHVVRVSEDPHMTIVNEFTDGGTFEHEDCGPASLQSWFIDRARVRTTVKVIEGLAGTDLNGTGFTGLINAGQHFGEQIKFSGDNPPRGYIMNPGGFTSIVDISEFDSYLEATQGGCLVLPNIVWAPAPTPAPEPDTQEDDDMPKLSLFVAKTPVGNAVFVSDGMFFRHVPSPTPGVPNPEPDEATLTGPWFNGDGKALRLWNANPVGDVAAFGTPANAETAKLVGLPFP